MYRREVLYNSTETQRCCTAGMKQGCDFFCHEALYRIKSWLNVEVAWDIAIRIIAINRLDIPILSHPYSFYLIPSLLLIPLPLLLLLTELHQGSAINHIPCITQPESKLPLPRMFYWISFQTSYVIYKNDPIRMIPYVTMGSNHLSL